MVILDLVSKMLDWKVHLHLTIAKGAFTNYVDKTRHIGLEISTDYADSLLQLKRIFFTKVNKG